MQREKHEAATVEAVATAKDSAIEAASLEIQALTSRLKTLPTSDFFFAERCKIQSRIDALKKEITASKPLEQQLITCTAALARARKRAVAARTALQGAQSEVATADAAVQELSANQLRLKTSIDEQKHFATQDCLKMQWRWLYVLL